MWEFFKRWPTAKDAAEAVESDIVSVISTLGLSNRRARTLKRMSDEFLNKSWDDPIELYGIGKYGSDAWHIFRKGDWESVSPKDHALVFYHDWLKEELER